MRLVSADTTDLIVVCRRDHPVKKDTLIKRPLVPLEAVKDHFFLIPKDIWLSSFCRAVNAIDQRTFVYVRQISMGDVNDRLESVLSNPLSRLSP